MTLMDARSLADALDLDRCSSSTIRKATMLVMSGSVWRDAKHVGVFWVPASGNPDLRYRVQVSQELPPWISCTCPYGQRKGSGKVGCYHAAAVLRLMAKNEH